MVSSARYRYPSREIKSTLSLTALASLAELVDDRGLGYAIHALGVGKATLQACLDEVGVSSRAARRLEQILAGGAEE